MKVLMILIQFIRKLKTENKDEDLYDYDRIDIEEFKIEPGDVNINEESSDQNNINKGNELE